MLYLSTEAQVCAVGSLTVKWISLGLRCDQCTVLSRLCRVVCSCIVVLSPFQSSPHKILETKTLLSGKVSSNKDEIYSTLT